MNEKDTFNKELNKKDIKENSIKELTPSILEVLLKDMTSKKNIIWATDTYKSRGFLYNEDAPITIELITGRNGNLIKPRIEKSKKEQLLRSKKKAEVFTPSWVCNVQNNLVDEAWFGYRNVFNFEKNNKWVTNCHKIEFPANKNWKEYVLDNRLEMSCGEAPYLVSRYDTVTGEIIPVKQRIGILDRKLRIVCENTNNEEEWLKWSEQAYKHIYGYDFQGDNILIARENLLFTLMDYYQEKFSKEIGKDILLNFANIISWNIWQMDGIKGVIPNSCKNEIFEQINLFGEKISIGKKCTGCIKGNIFKHNGKKCIIMDWDKNKKIKYISLLGGKNG